MALINCQECNKEISDKVKACPHCGYPLNEDIQKVEVSSIKFKKMDAKKKRILIIVVAILIIVSLISVSGWYIFNGINNQNVYNSAIKLLEEQNYQEAVKKFDTLGNYKDSKAKAIQAYGENFEETTALIYINCMLSQLKCYYISETWDNAIDSRYKDFNTEIQKLLGKWKNSGLTEQGAKLKEDIDNKVATLQNPVEGYTEAHKLLVEMYGIYVQMYEQSNSPTGSLLTFNSTIKNMSSDFEKAYNQITVMKPTIKERVKEEKKETNIQNKI